MPDGDRSPQEISRTRLREIFRRAVELEHLAPDEVDVRELYDIAAEVGISPTILERAIRETRENEGRRDWATRSARIFRRAITGIAAGVIGGLTKFLTFIASPPPFFSVIAIAPLTAVALLLAVYSRSRGGYKTFWVDNAILWLGFGIGFVWLGLTGPADLIPPLLGWSVAGILGFIVIRRVGKEPPDSPDVDASFDRLLALPSERPPVDDQFTHYLNPLRDWVVMRISKAALLRPKQPGPT